MPGVARRLAHDAALAAFGAAASWMALRTGFGAAGTRKPLLACMQFSLRRTGAAGCDSSQKWQEHHAPDSEAGTDSRVPGCTSAAAAALSSSLSRPASWVQSTGVAERGLGGPLGGRVWRGSSLGPGEADLGTCMALSASNPSTVHQTSVQGGLKEAACGAPLRLQEAAVVSDARLGARHSGSHPGSNPSQVRLRAWPEMNARTIQPDSRCAALPDACHSSRAVPGSSASVASPALPGAGADVPQALPVSMLCLHTSKRLLGGASHHGPPCLGVEGHSSSIHPLHGCSQLGQALGLILSLPMSCATPQHLLAAVHGMQAPHPDTLGAVGHLHNIT